jgi:hypothetical protein
LQEVRDFINLSDKAEMEEGTEVGPSWLTMASESTRTTSGMEDVEQALEIVEGTEEIARTAEEVEQEIIAEETEDSRIAEEIAPQTEAEEEEDRIAKEQAEEAVWEDDKSWQISTRKQKQVDDEVSFYVSDDDETTANIIVFFIS